MKSSNELVDADEIRKRLHRLYNKFFIGNEFWTDYHELSSVAVTIDWCGRPDGYQVNKQLEQLYGKMNQKLIHPNKWFRPTYRRLMPFGIFWRAKGEEKNPTSKSSDREPSVEKQRRIYLRQQQKFSSTTNPTFHHHGLMFFPQELAREMTSLIGVNTMGKFSSHVSSSVVKQYLSDSWISYCTTANRVTQDDMITFGPKNIA